MPNSVYRGPVDRQYQTVTDRACAGAYLPCTAVFIGAALTQATSASGGRLALLGVLDFYASPSDYFNLNDPRRTAYASAETGVAHVLEPGQVYQWAVAAGSYTRGQELPVGAAGRLTAASAGQVVVAHFEEPSATKSAGDLCDVAIANAYTK